MCESRDERKFLNFKDEVMKSFSFAHYDFTLSKDYEKHLRNGQSASPLISLFWVQKLSDAGDVRDFIYNAFQESREQLGKILSFLCSLVDGKDYTPLE